MTNRIIFSFLVFLFVGLIFFACSKDENPITPLDNEPVIYGKVVDEQGNPVSGVNVHYLPSLIYSYLPKRSFLDPNIPIYINFSLPKQTIVTLVLLTHSTRDTVFYILKNELRNAGVHSINVNVDSLTNGIYDYVLKYGTTIIEKSFLLNKEPDDLVLAVPLTTTDNEGKFELNYRLFGIGSKFGIHSESSPEIIGYKEITDTIQIFLVKETFNNYLETIVIDTNKTTRKNFIITKP